MTEQPPCHRDIGGLRHPVKEIVQRAVAAAHVDEFVHIDMDDPLGIADQRFLQRLVQRGLLGGIALPAVVVAMLQQSHLLHPVQDLGGAIGAVVGIDQEIVDPNGAMIGDPFRDIGGLVLHAADDHAPRGSRRQIARLARRIGTGQFLFIDHAQPVMRPEGRGMQLVKILYRQGRHDPRGSLAERGGRRLAPRCALWRRGRGRGWCWPVDRRRGGYRGCGLILARSLAHLFCGHTLRPVDQGAEGQKVLAGPETLTGIGLGQGRRGLVLARLRLVRQQTCQRGLAARQPFQSCLNRRHDPGKRSGINGIAVDFDFLNQLLPQRARHDLAGHILQPVQKRVQLARTGDPGRGRLPGRGGGRGTAQRFVDIEGRADLLGGVFGVDFGRIAAPQAQAARPENTFPVLHKTRQVQPEGRGLCLEEIALFRIDRGGFGQGRVPP